MLLGKISGGLDPAPLLAFFFFYPFTHK